MRVYCANTAHKEGSTSAATLQQVLYKALFAIQPGAMQNSVYKKKAKECSIMVSMAISKIFGRCSIHLTLVLQKIILAMLPGGAVAAFLSLAIYSSI